jgi:lipoprotein-anchoring transpeptidase ErfK/SrfK
MLVSLATPTAHAAPAARSARPIDPGGGSLVAYVKEGHGVALLARPGGRRLGVVGAFTEFGTRQALPVVRTRGRWLGVVATSLPNGRVGWLDSASGSVAFGRVRVRLDADLSQQVLRVRVGDRVARRIRLGVGRAGSRTPTGRFSITDKLRGPDYGSYYGCCILALSGHQTHLPRGWKGGNRLAIHGGSTAGAVSAGCLHASTRDLRYLMRVVPVGTQVVIHA